MFSHSISIPLKRGEYSPHPIQFHLEAVLDTLLILRIPSFFSPILEFLRDGLKTNHRNRLIIFLEIFTLNTTTRSVERSSHNTLKRRLISRTYFLNELEPRIPSIMLNRGTITNVNQRMWVNITRTSSLHMYLCKSAIFPRNYTIGTLTKRQVICARNHVKHSPTHIHHSFDFRSPSW